MPLAMILIMCAYSGLCPRLHNSLVTLFAEKQNARNHPFLPISSDKVQIHGWAPVYEEDVSRLASS